MWVVFTVMLLAAVVFVVGLARGAAALSRYDEADHPDGATSNDVGRHRHAA